MEMKTKCIFSFMHLNFLRISHEDDSSGRTFYFRIIYLRIYRLSYRQPLEQQATRLLSFAVIGIFMFFFLLFRHRSNVSTRNFVITLWLTSWKENNRVNKAKRILELKRRFVTLCFPRFFFLTFGGHFTQNLAFSLPRQSSELLPPS